MVEVAGRWVLMEREEEIRHRDSSGCQDPPSRSEWSMEGKLVFEFGKEMCF
jgi:hypothetical protein